MANYSINLGPWGSVNPIKHFESTLETLKLSLSSASADPYPTITFVGAVIVTARFALLFFKKDGRVGFSDVIVVIASWAGHECAKNNSTFQMLNQSNEEMRSQLIRMREQLDKEKELRNLEQEDLERLRQTNAALEERIPQLEKAAEIHLQANEKHSSVIKDKRELLSHEKQELCRIKGLLEAYREELQELEGEIEASEKDKRHLKEEIGELLEEQKRINASFSEKLVELRAIEERLRKAAHIKGTI